MSVNHEVLVARSGRRFANLSRIPAIAFIACLLLTGPSSLAWADAKTHSVTPSSAPVSSGVMASPKDVGNVASGNSSAPKAPQPAKPLPRALTWSILIGVTVIWVIVLLAIFKGLRNQDWKIKDALTEEAVLPKDTPPPPAGALPPMVASSSRLIALVGMVILSAFFVAFGYIVLWNVCEGQPIDEAQNAWSYFLGGASLFLPYGVNKFSGILK